MSSSESEDENLKKFAASMDTTVFSDKLYKKAEGAEEEEEKPKVELKSQRFLDEDENIFQSEINVSSTMQKFIGNKLSKLIEDQIEFVEVEKKRKKKKSDEESAEGSIKLLKGTSKVIKYIDEQPFVENREKVPIKRRKLADDPDLDEATKIKTSSVTITDVDDDVKRWSNKSKHQPIEYKNLKGTGYLREPQNEFTKIRNKNNWSEAKITTGKYHNRPICDSIKK